MKKTWIKVKRGLLEPKHINQLGSAWYLYFYILDQAEWETGTISNWKDKYAADELNKPINLIREHRKHLQEMKYIKCDQGLHKQIITIHNWIDPRRYDGVVQNPENQGIEISEPCQQEEADGSGHGLPHGSGHGFSNPSENLDSSYSHISHNTTKDKNSPQKKLDDEFKALHQTIFSGSFNKTWWDVMESAPKELDGAVLKVKVDNPKIVNEVNGRSKSTQKHIEDCGFQFTSFELVCINQ